MKRRGFLKTIVGIVGAAVAGLKVKAAPSPPPIPAPESIHARFIWKEARDANQIHVWCSREQLEAYKRLGYDLGQSKPPGFGFDYLVNNDTDVWQPISRADYPELRAPDPKR